jgi:hypothetical protein
MLWAAIAAGLIFKINDIWIIKLNIVNHDFHITFNL